MVSGIQEIISDRNELAEFVKEFRAGENFNEIIEIHNKYPNHPFITSVVEAVEILTFRITDVDSQNKIRLARIEPNWIFTSRGSMSADFACDVLRVVDLIKPLAEKIEEHRNQKQLISFRQ